MQLFITDYSQKLDDIYILEKRVFDQLRKVLRAKAWYRFMLQKPLYVWENFEVERLTVELELYIDSQIKCRIISVEQISCIDDWKWVIISILNKFDKMDLIVQKLSEIWIKNIFFYPAKRSIIKDISKSKMERFLKISLEAIEQSLWYTIPNIRIIKSLDEIDWNIFILDKSWDELKSINCNNKQIYMLVWPEWWFEENEIRNYNILKINETILRSETASILCWWILKSMI